MKVCKICGETEDGHHEPDWLEIPEGCVCDWRTWDYEKMKKLPPACDKYEGNGIYNCAKCEHDQECHIVTCGSDIGNYHMVVPRKSANPSNLVAIRSTPITDVVLTWDGNCHEDPDLEYYSGNRRDVPEGDWKYDIQAIGENPEFSN